MCVQLRVSSGADIEEGFMARIIYCHPSLTAFDYHVFTDLDFWDARKLLRGLAWVKRNFASHISGDHFPTQVVGNHLDRAVIQKIERRLGRALVAPARHVIVRSMLFSGFFEFEPLQYFPERWSKTRMIHFTYARLPLKQSVLSNPYKTVQLTWVGNKIRIEQIQRSEKLDPAIRTERDAKLRLHVPSCF
jgi:hypothetical protein